MKNRLMQQQLIQLGNGAHALATQILGNPDDAADAVHDSFVKVFRKPEAYRESAGPLSPWFLRVVRNQCLDLIRKRRPIEPEVDEQIDPSPGPQQILENAQRDTALQSALDKLPSEQRQMIVLRDYMDLSYAEISEVLDIAKGTVMSRLHRARMALKEELSRNG
jgi:RNA polymerase sigma-70 factor (ECF subfamily)